MKPYIVGFTGTHGTGKTVVLDEIAALNVPEVFVDTLSVSRKVQSDWGLTLEQIVRDPRNVPHFQEQIRARKAERLDTLLDTYPHIRYIFTDRTPIDLYAYATQWTRDHSGFNHWLKDYTARCRDDMSAYDLTMLFPIRRFGFVAQPNRAPETTRREHHQLCKTFIRWHVRNRYTVVRPLSVSDRVQWCLAEALKRRVQAEMLADPVADWSSKLAAKRY